AVPLLRAPAPARHRAVGRSGARPPTHRPARARRRRPDRGGLSRPDAPGRAGVRAGPPRDPLDAAALRAGVEPPELLGRLRQGARDVPRPADSPLRRYGRRARVRAVADALPRVHVRAWARA